MCWLGITLLSWQVLLDLCDRTQAFMAVWKCELLFYMNSVEAATHYNVLISTGGKGCGDDWHAACRNNATSRDAWQRNIQAVIDRRRGETVQIYADNPLVRSAGKHSTGRKTSFSGVVRFREILVIPFSSGALVTFNGQKKILAEAVVANIARDYAIHMTYENIHGEHEDQWGRRAATSRSFNYIPYLGNGDMNYAPLRSMKITDEAIYETPDDEDIPYTYRNHISQQ